MTPWLRLELELIPRELERGGERAMRAPLVRRVLGAALIERHCPFDKHPRCRSISQKGTHAARRVQLRSACEQATSCPYGVLFAASRSDRPPFALYVPPVEADTPVERLEVTLLGPACEQATAVVHALGRALAVGLGQKRRSFALWRVLRQGEMVCGADLAELPAVIDPEFLGEPTLEPTAAGAVEVRLLSPLRLKRDGRLLKGDGPVTLAELCARVLERWEAVDAAEAPVPELGHDELLAAAEPASLIESEIRWVEERDWSASRRQQLRLGGKVGRLLFSDAAPLRPLLRAGEILHAGKNVTSGCGRLEVSLRD